MGKQSCVHLLLGACAGLASFVSVFVLLSGHLHVSAAFGYLWTFTFLQLCISYFARAFVLVPHIPL
jgi:hypothetical protein